MNIKKTEKEEINFVKEEDEEKEILEDEETILRKKIVEMNKEIDKQQNLH